VPFRITESGFCVYGISILKKKQGGNQRVFLTVLGGNILNAVK